MHTSDFWAFLGRLTFIFARLTASSCSLPDESGNNPANGYKLRGLPVSTNDGFGALLFGRCEVEGFEEGPSLLLA